RAEEESEGRARLLRPRAAPRPDVSAGADRPGAAQVPPRRAARRTRAGRALQQGGGADRRVALARVAHRAQARRSGRRRLVRDTASAPLRRIGGIPATAEGEIRMSDAVTADIAPGRLLAKLRAEHKLSVADVAQRLKYAVRQIEALEAEEFSRLPGTTTVDLRAKRVPFPDGTKRRGTRTYAVLSLLVLAAVGGVLYEWHSGRLPAGFPRRAPAELAQAAVPAPQAPAEAQPVAAPEKPGAPATAPDREIPKAAATLPKAPPAAVSKAAAEPPKPSPKPA